MAAGDTGTVFKGQLIRHPSRAREAATGRLWPGSPLLPVALGPSRLFLQADLMTLESIVECQTRPASNGEAQASHHKLQLDQCTAAATPPHTSQFNNQNNKSQV